LKQLILKKIADVPFVPPSNHLISPFTLNTLVKVIKVGEDLGLHFAAGS
jgi:hypothetical protein